MPIRVPRAIALSAALAAWPTHAWATVPPPMAVEGEPSGSLALSDDAFEVQAKHSFEVIYTVGSSGFGLGDELILQDPEFHGIRWSKWGDLSPHPELCTPQQDGQDVSWGLVSAYATRDGAELDGVRVQVERSNCTSGAASCTSDMHRRTTTTAWLETGTLSPGDELRVRIGDTTTCTDVDTCSDCGFEVPDRSFPAIPLSASECIAADCVDLDPVSLAVTAQAQVAALLPTVPSQALAGAPFALKVAVMDAWGNAADGVEVEVTVDLDGAEGSVDSAAHSYTVVDGGWHDFAVTIDAPGVYRLAVSSDQGHQATSNPVEVVDALPEHRIYWSDLHVHHGLNWIDDDGFDQDLNHIYARDIVGLDVAAESQKAKGVELDEDALWATLQDNCGKYTVDGAYLVMLGFEWMGEVAADEYGTKTEGHHNIYYDSCEAPIGTHDLDVIDTVDGERGLWQWLDEVRDTTGVDAVSVPHAMRYSGHNFDVSYPGTQTLAEIFSEWGDNTVLNSGAEVGTVYAIVRSGLRLGWIGASDNHDGWMGNPWSEKSTSSGLGALVAADLTRAEVFDAMKSRRTYATTGHRPILRAGVLDGPEDTPVEVPQGTELLAQDPVLDWRYHGTAALASVTVYRTVVGADAGTVFHQATDLDGPDHQGALDLDWDGTSDVGFWVEFDQVDGEKAWSSPVYLTADCDRLDAFAVDPLDRCDGAAADSGGPAVETDPPATRCACTTAGAAARGVFAVCALLALRRRRT